MQTSTINPTMLDTHTHTHTYTHSLHGARTDELTTLKYLVPLSGKPAATHCHNDDGTPVNRNHAKSR